MLLDVRPDHMKVVLSVLRTFVPNAEVFAFGSRAKWNAKDSSDLDLCVRAGHPLGFGLMGDLLDAFSESSLPYKVDVVDWERISPSFRTIIETDKVLIYSSEEEQISGMMATEYGQLSTQLSRAKLEDLCEKGGVQTGPFGSQLHKEDYVDDGVPIITVEHLGENRLMHENLPRVSEEDYQRLSKYKLKQGDIVFSRVGSVDRRAIVQQQEDGWLFSGRCLRVRPNPEKIDSTWLSYFFGLPSFKEYIRSIAVGATMPSLNTKILSDVPIYFPNLEEQQEIGKILSALDDKVALLRESNSTLEAIAQALFKSWFVDFDPVRAKAEGREPEGVPLEIAKLFPGEFEESELGAIPKGWSTARVGMILELAYGKALKATDRNEGDVPVYGSGGVTGSHDKSLVDGPSIIVGRKGTVGSLYWEDKAFYPIDTVFYVKPLIAPLTYCYYLLQTLGLDGMNTDAAVPGLNRENAYQLKVILPPSSLLERFDEYVSMLRRRIFTASEEISHLSSARDALLPRLMSGQLCLPEAMVKEMTE